MRIRRYRAIKKFWVFFDHTINFLAYLAGAILIFIMFSIAAEVIHRKILGSSIAWVIEYSEYALVYITFFGTAWLLRRDGHVKMDLLTNRLKPRMEGLLGIVMSIAAAIACLITAWYGAAVTWDMFLRGIYRETTILQTPLAPLLIPIPVGCLLLSIQFVRRAYGYLAVLKTEAKVIEEGFLQAGGEHS